MVGPSWELDHPRTWPGDPYTSSPEGSKTSAAMVQMHMVGMTTRGHTHDRKKPRDAFGLPWPFGWRIIP